MVGCIACDLAEGRVDLPGGRIHETEYWLVEHCIGPLGVGTLIVKPKRHVVHLWELTTDEAVEFGPLMHKTSAAVAISPSLSRSTPASGLTDRLTFTSFSNQ